MAVTEGRWPLPIDDRDAVTPGVRLSGRYKGTTYRAEIEGWHDWYEVVLEDGRRFASLSAAASAVMGGISANGWRFWSIDPSSRPGGRRGPNGRRKRARQEPVAPTPRPRRSLFAVLGISPLASFDEARRAYRALAMKLHPDAGGSHEEMVELNAAYDEIRLLLGPER